MLVSGSIPALIGGVSQQPSELRAPSQLSSCSNFYPSEADGLLPRPPLLHIAKVADTAFAAPLLHTINRDSDDRFLVVLLDGDLKVYDLEGVEKTVAFPDGKAYLDTGAKTPQESLRAATVADYTFIVNRGVTPAMGAALGATRPFEALAVVIYGSPRHAYSLTLEFIDGSGTFTGNHSSGSGDDDVSAASYHTYRIADELLNDFQAAAEAAGFTLVRDGSVIYASHATKDFRIKSEDGENNNAIKTFKSRTQRFSALPGRAEPGFLMEVIGEEGTEFDNYYVEYQATVSGSHSGAWRETRKPGIKYQIDAATMPHTLIHEADGTFTFKQATWGERKVGDEDSSPEPSFIGRPIDDVFLYRGRLGFLAGEGVILSDTTDLFNFWRKTVTTDLDDDPIDIVSGGAEVTRLRSAAPLSSRLVLFGDQHQLGLTSQDSLSARTVTVDQLSHFDALAAVRPVGVGTELYFAQQAGTATRLRAMFVRSDGETFDAEDVTAQAPAYIPAGVFQLAASPVANLVAAAAGAARSLHLYKFHLSGDQRVQSAVFDWQFPVGAVVGGVAFLSTSLYVLYTLGGATYIGKVPLERGITDPSATYLTRLDRRADETLCTKELLVATPGVPERTKVTLPWPRTDDTTLVSRVDPADATALAGEVPKVLDQGADWLTVEGDYTARTFYVGDLYLCAAELSRVLLRRTGQDGQEKPVVNGRLQLRYASLHYADSGPFKLIVTPAARAPVTYEFTGRRLGTAQTGTPPIDEEGNFRVPIQSNAAAVDIRIEVRSHLPGSFQAFAWEGFFYDRAETNYRRR